MQLSVQDTVLILLWRLSSVRGVLMYHVALLLPTIGLIFKILIYI